MDVAALYAGPDLRRLRLLADPHRLRITMILLSKPQTVSEVAGLLGIGVTLTSHHLRTLQRERVVEHRKVGRTAIYSIHREIELLETTDRYAIAFGGISLSLTRNFSEDSIVAN